MSQTGPNNYFPNINIISIIDKMIFWKLSDCFSRTKFLHVHGIHLFENGTVLSDDQVVAGTFNNYFNLNKAGIFESSFLLGGVSV